MNTKREIVEFINSNENCGAMLITGKWGCGKSYMIKDVIKELNDEKKAAVAIISLFGVDSIAMLNYRVKEEYISFKSVLIGKTAKKAAKAVGKLLKTGADVVATATPDISATAAVSAGISSVLSFNIADYISVKNEVGPKDNKRPFVLVFDDFERSRIDIVDLLGAINDYTENKSIKTILIADEDKIKQKDYDEFKEKLIYETIKLVPDYDQIITGIIQNYTETVAGYQEFLEEHKNTIISVFNDSSSGNLRTVKAILFHFERVFDVWRTSEVPMYDMDRRLYQFCAIMFEYKAGNYSRLPLVGYVIRCKDKDGDALKKANEEIKAKYHPDTFAFTLNSLSKWVADGEWDEEQFVLEIKNKYVIQNLTHEEKFINYDFWDLQQEDINSGMPLLVERAYKGEASHDELIALLQNVHLLNENGINLPCEVDYNKLKKGLELHIQKIESGEIELQKSHRYVSDNNIDNEAIDLNHHLESMDDAIYAWNNQKLFIDYLNKNPNIAYYDLKGKCIKAFDDELLNLFTDKYNKSSNSDKRELCWAMQGLCFSDKTYSSIDDINITIGNFEKLYKNIQNSKSTDKDAISVVIANSFTKWLNEKIIEIKEKIA